MRDNLKLFLTLLLTATAGVVIMGIIYRFTTSNAVMAVLMIFIFLFFLLLFLPLQLNFYRNKNREFFYACMVFHVITLVMIFPFFTFQYIYKNPLLGTIFGIIFAVSLVFLFVVLALENTIKPKVK